MVLSISNKNTVLGEPGRGGLFFVNVGEADGHAGEIFYEGTISNKTLNRNVAYYELPSPHPGGLQVMGSVVATVGVDETLNRPMVWFFDVSDPIHTPRDEALIQRVDLNTLGPDVTNSASAVAITRLASGRFLMLVNGTSLEETRTVWMYISDQATLDSDTTWRVHNTYSYRVAFGTENIAFVTQCDGSVYLLHTSNTDPLNDDVPANYVATHQLVVANGKLTTVSINAQASSIQNDGYCNFRAAAGFYSTPSGKLVVYCNSRKIITEDGNFRFGEWPAQP